MLFLRKPQLQEASDSIGPSDPPHLLCLLASALLIDWEETQPRIIENLGIKNTVNTNRPTFF